MIIAHLEIAHGHPALHGPQQLAAEEGLQAQDTLLLSLLLMPLRIVLVPSVTIFQHADHFCYERDMVR